MPHKYDWCIKGQVIFTEIWGDQTQEELEDSNIEMINHIESSDRLLVHVIIKDENLESIPVSLMKMNQILTYTTHPKLGWVVATGKKKNNVTDFIIIMLAKVTRARYIRVKTFDEAVKHLQKVDQSIDWNELDPTESEKIDN